MLINKKFNPNYYPSVASVDSSSIESICIFPETLNKMHNRMCGNNTSKQNNFLISNNTQNKDKYQWITHKYKSISCLKQETNKVPTKT